MSWEEKPSWYTGGPYLLVALPRVVNEFIPLNASSLVREWESMLDPVRSLGCSAQRFLDRLAWVVGETFVEPSFVTLEWLRRVSRDEHITAAFGRSTGDLLLAGYEEPILLPRFLTRDPRAEGTEVLNDQAMPVLLGLAVIAALYYQLGSASVAIQAKLPEDFDARIDRQREGDERDRRAAENRRLDQHYERDRQRVREEEAEFFEKRGIRQPHDDGEQTERAP